MKLIFVGGSLFGRVELMPLKNLLFFMTMKMVMELKHGCASTNKTCISSYGMRTFWPSCPQFWVIYHAECNSR